LESKDIYYSLPQSISPSSKFDNWTRNQKYSVLGKPKYTETLPESTKQRERRLAMKHGIDKYTLSDFWPKWIRKYLFHLLSDTLARVM
jgi:hypothetical protein